MSEQDESEAGYEERLKAIEERLKAVELILLRQVQGGEEVKGDR